jgi:hypothetical protein
MTHDMTRFASLSSRALLLLTLAVVPGCASPGDVIVTSTTGRSTHALDAVDFGDTDSPSKHLVMLHLEGGVSLWFFFAADQAVPGTIELHPPGSDDEDLQGGATLLDNGGFEGGVRDLCQTSPGFPGTSVSSGTVRIDSVELDGRGRLTGIVGLLDVDMVGCTAPALGLHGEDAHFSAAFL